MKKSYKSILLLFLVMILAMSAVSAADADDTSDSDLQAVDEVAVDEVASADVDDVVSTDSAADVVADPGDGNNFTSLQTQINGITTNPTIHLSSDIERTDEDSSITIDKQTVIIMGDNHKIDASQKGGIFTVSPDCTLVLQDVTLINAKGNAIHNQGNLVLIGVTFEDNTASENGVIYNDNAYLDISGSSFINNDGGAIVSYGGTLSISGSTFSGNTADDGGAILVEDAILSISDSIFEDNKATYTGGALNIYNINQNTIAIDNCTFKRNDAIQGGAISTGVYGDEHEGALIINDCTFDANTVHTSSLAQSLGSAICVGNENNGDIFNLDITGSTFINHVTGFNGAVVVDQCNLKVDDCEFKDNSAGSGAALFAQKGTLTITDSNFTNNNAIFDAADPTHTGYAGAVYAENNAVLSIENCKFVGNNGTDGGAVRSNGKTTIKDSTFESNTATAGGAIATKGDVEITGTTFTGNKATVQGGAIYSTGTLNVYGSTFTANEITNGSTWKAEVTNGGAGIYIGEGSSLTVTKSNFTSNTGVAAYNVYTLGGGIFVNQAESVLIDTCKFDSNVVGQGGAVAFEDFSQTTDAITGCEFNNNKAWQGGAVNINTAVENLIISDSIFTGNQAIEPDLGDASTMGGAIIIGTRSTVSTNVEINGCNFTGNDGGKFGGAVMIGGNSSATIDDCDFKENTATTLGGAICNDGKAIDNVITNSNFEKNNAGSMGGAVFLGTYAGTGISNSVFTENTATNHGNAVCTYAETELTNNTFSDETADVKARGTGEIITNWIVTVMDGKDYFVNFNQIKLYANVTDDNGNLIELTNAKFTFNGEDVIDATWNATSKLYEALYTPTTEGTYVVSLNVEGDHVDITTATIRFTRTLSDLANKIASANAGDIIGLDANYAYIEEFDSAYVNGIVIDKALTINGNGHTISGSNAARIFKVNAATTINNTKLVNGSTAASGGAIWSTADLTIDNCVFDGNNITTRTTSERDGGAIFAESGKLKVYNSNFTNNIQNYALLDNIQGGAIGSYSSDVTIDNCNFTGNSALLGAAIMVWTANCDGVVLINNSKFINNFAYQGGAILAQQIATLTIDNSVFNNNEVKGTETPTKKTWASGAAIHADAQTTITNSNFTGNKAEYNGGAVYIQQYKNSNTNGLIDNCRFEDNAAGVYYGAVYYSGSKELTVKDSYFDNNTARYAKSIGILGGKLDLSGNTITGDEAEILIRNDDPNYSSEVTSQINITVMDNGTYAYSFHAIKLYANITDDNGNIIKDTTFKFLVGTTPVDAKYNETTKLYEATFNPVVGEYVVSMTYTGTGTLNIKTAKISFARSLIDIQNMIDAASAGDTITLDGDYAYIEEFDKTIVNGIVVNKNITIDGKGKTISGSDLARLFNVTAPYTLTLTNVTLTKGKADEGAAVYVEAGATLKADYVNFVNNTAVKKGGAIYSEGIVEIDHSVFDENTITDRKVDYSLNHGGAAIYNYDGTLTVNNTKFINHVKGYSTADERIDGTITTSGTTKIYNSVFENNSARYGTDICAIPIPITTGTQTISLTVDGCNFTTSTTFAGAIQVQKANVVIKDCIFNESTASGVPTTGYTAAGAAICAMANSDVTISGSQFNNMIGPKGGAILAQDIKKINISNTNFTNCIATGTGSSATKGYGGAVFLERVSEESTIEGCVFKDNNALYGGAIAIVGAQATVKDSNFTNNHATNGSSIYNEGTLALSGNKVVSTDAEIESKGTITSTIKVVILNGEVKTINTLEANLTAKVTDDTGINLIKDAQFKFTINGKEVPAVYDNGLYKATYTLPSAGIYPVNITYASDDELEVENATVKSIYGAFTQLQQLIDNATDTLVLPYNFTYNAEIDGDAFKAGVVINKALTVDGNGSTISGADAARIFQLNNNTINIKNTTFTNGHANTSSAQTADWGGAIYSNGAYIKHVISDCKFYNNTAYNGGAIYLGSDGSDIIGCEFEDNNATASGGAVFLYGWNDAISDSTFKFNMADELGGAVACYSSQQAANITNSVFIGNVALKNGGAVSMQRAAGKITDSNFTGNTAYNGGAVYWGSEGGSISGGEFIENEAFGDLGGAIFAEGTGLTITSTFTENYADNGGAIAVFNDTTITESTFTNNTADNYGGAIYVNGSAKLDITKSVMKNNSATVGSSIYSNGTIGSTIVNATILDNKTWNDTGLGKIYELNATLTDDMGNSIYDPNFRFTVNGVEIADNPSYDDETGLYTLDYVVEKARLNVISTSYTADNLEVFTGALDIPLANVTEFTVFAFDILEDENATVFVKLVGVNDIGLNANVTVIVNNKEYPVLVENGTGNITIENLTHGQYPVVAMFKDPNYEYTINSTVFNVKGQAVLNITELTTAEYGDVIEITINLTDSEGNPLSGVVVIDEVIKVLVEEGIGTFVIDNQPDVGKYSFQAVYDGDNDYFGDLALFNVTVTAKELDQSEVEFSFEGDYDNGLNITITSPVDGNYTVDINGTKVTVEVVNSTGSAIAKLDKPDDYTAVITLNDENYSLEPIEYDVVYKGAPEFNVEINGTYPNAEIRIFGTPGTYHVDIDGFDTINITVSEYGLPGVAPIEGIAAGDYTAIVSYDANDEYRGDYKEVDFTIDKSSDITEFTVFASDILESKNATVFVTLIGVDDIGLNATVTVIVNNKEYAVLVENGTGNITIEDLAHGQYPVVAMLDDPNYESAIDSTVFNVKGQAVLNITELTTAEYGDVIEITINLTDSEGNPLSGVVVIDDVTKVLVEEGIGTFVIDNQPDVGTYQFQADYYGDEDYFGDLAIFNVTVTPKELDQDEVEFSFEGDYDNGLNITITSPVDGNYTVDINGTNVTVEVVDGTGSAIAKLDKPDDYTAVITLDDENYSLEPIEYDVVYKGAPEFTVEINGTYPNAEIRIFGTPGTYHVDIDGFDTINITVSEYEIPGVAPIEGIAAGNYTAIVSYDTNDEYRGDYKEVNFTVAKAPLTIDEPAIIGDKVIDSQINITFTLPADVDPSNVAAYMDGVPVPTNKFIINETTGLYTLVLDGFATAEGHFFVVQVNDPNYEENMTQVSFTIEKITPTLEVNDATGEWDKPVDIPIKLTGADGTPITGDVIVTVSWDVDGVTQVVRLNETGEGVATFAITEALGNLTVTAKYYGDDKYNAVEKTATLTITESMEAKLVVVADSQVPYKDTVYVNVTLNNVRDVAIENATITYSVDGGEAQTAKVDEYGLVSIPVTGLAGGKHTIEVTFNNESYSNSPVSESVTVTVTPIAPVFTSDVTQDAKVGENVTITITAPGLTGNFTVTVDSEPVTFDLPVIDGVAIINITGLAAGHHSYEVTYNGDENYTDAADANSFDVVQVPTETALNVTIPENTTTPVFSIELPEDATGYLLVDVDGEQYYAPLVNGSASIETAPLAGGNHTVKVTYTGDDKYAGFSNTTNMTIDSNVTADTALDVPASSENTPTFSVNLPSDATGFLTVDVDGKKYAAVVENGKASISVPGLSEGNHNVTVIYSGDAKYPTLTKDATVNVHIPVYKITQNKNINVVYSAKATYKVLITKDGKAVGAGETVTIKYNGKTYNVKTDSKGYATLKLSTKVKVKSYTITATYQGVSVKNTVKVKHVIKASNKKVKKSRKVTKIKITLRKVNNKYLAKKTIKVKFKGKTYKVKTNKKGVATWKVKKSMVKKLKVGKKYKYRVTYGKDVLTKKLTIKR